jgi:hypothetical protein
MMVKSMAGRLVLRQIKAHIDDEYGIAYFLHPQYDDALARKRWRDGFATPGTPQILTVDYKATSHHIERQTEC